MKINSQNRILSLLLAILLLPTFMVIPARADDTDSGLWIQILDYGYAEGHQDNYFNLDTTSSNKTLNLYYPNPSNGLLYNYDIIFRTDDSSPRIGSYSEYLNIISLGDGLYRAVGRQNASSNYASFQFLYTDGSYFQVLSFRASLFPFARYIKPYSGYVYDYSYDPIKETFFSGNGSTPMTPVNITPNQYTAGATAGHVSRISIDQWQSMDFITLNIATWSTIFTSLKVEVSGFPVPYSINTVESDNVQGVTLYLLDITIDLRSIDRTLSSPLSVDLSGQVKYPYSGTFTVQSCLGLVSLDAPSTETFWFTKIINSISSGFASVGTWISNQTSSLVSWLSQINTSLAIGFDGVSTWLSYVHNAIGTGFSNVSTWISNQTFSITTSISTWGQNIVNALNPQADSNEFRDEVENIRDQMQDANDAMNELERPPIDEVISGVDMDVGVGSPFSEIMGSFFENEFIVSIITGSLAFTVFGLLVG